MTNRYKHKFASQNDPEQTFTLTFEHNGSHRLSVIDEVEVYQHRNDTFLKLSTSQSKVRYHITAESILGSIYKFYIDIYTSHTGIEIIIIESVRTTIVNTTLQPCNIQDHP